MESSDNNAITTVSTPEVPQVGWSARSLRIGRLQLDFVRVHDALGAHHFGSFITSQIASTKRHRPGRAATRYLEHLSHATPARLLSLEAADYLTDMQRRELARTTIINQRHAFRMLTLACGDIPVSEITSQHIRDLWDVMRWWPKNVGNLKKYRGLTDEEILKIGRAAQERPPSRQTMELAKRQLTAFFHRLVKMRVIVASPMEGFGKIKESLIQNKTRRAFTTDELVRIFSPETYLPWAKKSPHAWWGPILGLHTGARVGEVAQLKVADVFDEGGIWCLHFCITPDANGEITQTLKGASSVRVVPIPSAVLDMGFLEFVEDARRHGHTRLFPNLSRGKARGTTKANGSSYGARLGQHFGTHLNKHHPEIERGQAFHGFRHTLSTALGLHGVPVELIASITGHSGERQKFPVLQKHYMHISTASQRQSQLAALDQFKPPVSMPKYVSGQFDKQLGPNAKKHR